MKIGILSCLYGVPDLAKQCLDPWFELKDELNLVIGCCHSQFKEYAEFDTNSDTETLNILKQYKFDSFYIGDRPMLEHEVRDIVLQDLLKLNVDYVILLDGDEIWTTDQIKELISVIKKNPLYAWFSIEYKNLTFNKNTYTLGFCPPRVFKVEYVGCKLRHFYWDNDISYIQANDKTAIISYRDLPNKKIQTILPTHHTWLNDERSRKKIIYQEKHFANGSGCSFKWDDGLKWNEDFFVKTGQTKPILLTDLT